MVEVTRKDTPSKARRPSIRSPEETRPDGRGGERDTVVRLALPGSSVADDPLLLVLRSGARRMLQQVIEAELEAFLRAHAGLEDAHGRRRVVRNGQAPEREIQTGIGAISVRRPPTPRQQAASGAPG